MEQNSKKVELEFISFTAPAEAARLLCSADMEQEVQFTVPELGVKDWLQAVRVNISRARNLAREAFGEIQEFRAIHVRTLETTCEGISVVVMKRSLSKEEIPSFLLNLKL